VELIEVAVENAPERRVLVVDDDRDALQISSDFFEARGWAAVLANDGHEALARFHDEGPFDVIVLDVMMPGIDGMEVCRRLKASPQGQLTPILLLSARSDTRSRVAGLYGGADDYMTKPVDLRELAARVDALVRVRDRYLLLSRGREEGLEAAITDGLSGAANAEYFRRRLHAEIARADRYRQPLVVVIADVKGLPEPGGAVDPGEDSAASLRFAGPADALIAAVGETLRTNVRAHDLVARLRRSRFALMLPQLSRQRVAAAIDRLRGLVEAIPADGEGGDSAAGLTLRAGWAELGPRMDVATLLARAEPR
jgi:PleD family two-component response regulator